MEQQTNDYKQFWKDTELVPNSLPDTQLPLLIETLKKELDFGKIETVLEVGVGYGRVAKALLDDPDNVINLYDGVDISEKAINQSEEYLKEHMIGSYTHQGYCPYPSEDFETCPIPEIYDMVISVETMSVVPHDIRPWIDKMISLSKKYVVNLDFTRGNDTITNNPPHKYWLPYTCATIEKKLVNWEEIRIPNNESIFIGHMR